MPPPPHIREYMYGESRPPLAFSRLRRGGIRLGASSLQIWFAATFDLHSQVVNPKIDLLLIPLYNTAICIKSPKAVVGFWLAYANFCAN